MLSAPGAVLLENARSSPVLQLVSKLLNQSKSQWLLTVTTFVKEESSIFSKF